jgi:hypothetical protein
VSTGWWLADLREEISRGDVYESVPFSLLTEPLTHLRYADGPKGKPAWMEHDQPVKHKATQRAHVLSAFRPAPGIILSHDCEIDKDKDRPRWLMAPIAKITTLGSSQQEVVMGQRHLALVPLPGVPTLGDCFADLRNMGTVPARLISTSARLCSMSDDGRTRVRDYLATFLLRKDPGGQEIG